MPAGNNAQYETSQGCSIYGLSIGCPVVASDGWYYDGNYGNSYYISNGSVSSIDTAPCVTSPPPPPPPVTYDYYQYEQCTGAKQYTGVLITIELAAGSTPPSSVTYGAYCWALYSGALSSPPQTPVSYSSTNCNCN